MADFWEYLPDWFAAPAQLTSLNRIHEQMAETQGILITHPDSWQQLRLHASAETKNRQTSAIIYT
jgi:hypothetical protein